MGTALYFLGAIITFVVSIIVLIDAFKSAVWKGIVGLLCGLYLLYYMFAEFQHEKKKELIIAWVVGVVLIMVGGGMGGMAAIGAATPVPNP